MSLPWNLGFGGKCELLWRLTIASANLFRIPLPRLLGTIHPCSRLPSVLRERRTCTTHYGPASTRFNYSSPCVLQHMPIFPAARSFVNIDPKIHAYLRSIEDRVSKVVCAVAVVVAVADAGAAKPGTPLPSRTWGMAPWLSAEALRINLKIGGR